MLTAVIFCTLLNVAVTKDTLRYVQILFRHGDRTPTHAYPNDPYQSWPEGWEQLTSIGMRQEYELGQFIRSRYVDSGFLHGNYTVGDIYVLSSYKDRCIMSADCMLAGLYPPSGEQVWNPAIPWRPVPVHVIPDGEDFMLKMKCPRYDKLYSEYISSDHVKPYKEEFQDIIDLTGQYSGYEATFENTIEMVDPVYVEISHNLTLPAWLRANDTYERFLSLKDVKSALKFPTLALTRIRGGPVLKQMLKNMEDVRDFKNITQKIDFFSAHDTTINGLLSALKVYNKLHMMYAAAAFVELHHSTADEWTVRILYRNDTTVPPYVMTVPGCDEFCPLSELKRLTRDAVPDDVIEECLGPRPPPVTCSSSALSHVGSWKLACVFLLYVICSWSLRRR